MRLVALKNRYQITLKSNLDFTKLFLDFSEMNLENSKLFLCFIFARLKTIIYTQGNVVMILSILLFYIVIEYLGFSFTYAYYRIIICQTYAPTIRQRIIYRSHRQKIQSSEFYSVCMHESVRRFFLVIYQDSRHQSCSQDYVIRKFVSDAQCQVHIRRCNLQARKIHILAACLSASLVGVCYIHSVNQILTLLPLDKSSCSKAYLMITRHSISINLRRSQSRQ